MRIRLRLRTLMLIVALVALGLASDDPVLALLLIASCPLWFVAIVSRWDAKPRSSGRGIGRDPPDPGRARPQ